MMILGKSDVVSYNGNVLSVAKVLQDKVLFVGEVGQVELSLSEVTTALDAGKLVIKEREEV
tara:strand:+ start:865 stop:1047 length:183 start_codon:yes stop_codon:yes gene_type:complete